MKRSWVSRLEPYTRIKFGSGEIVEFLWYFPSSDTVMVQQKPKTRHMSVDAFMKKKPRAPKKVVARFKEVEKNGKR